MTRVLIGSMALAVAMALAEAVWAAQWNWLRDAPANFFTEQDWEILGSTVDRVLATGNDATEVPWDNPETGHGGTVTPLDSTDEQGVICRRARVFNSAGGVTNVGTYRFCRQPDGTWKISPPK